MSGLLRRLTRRRPATADEPGAETPGAHEPAAAPAEDPALGGGATPAQQPVSGAEWATGTFGRAEQSPGSQPANADPSAGDPPTTAFDTKPPTASGTEPTGEPPTASGAEPTAEPPIASGSEPTGQPPTTAFGAPHAGLSSGDPLDAGAGALGRPVAASAEQPTQIIGPTVDVAAVQPQQLAAAHTLAPAPPPIPGRDLPAGVDPAELQVAPAPSARRGRLRRRLRYLRRVRELLLRDLGGFFYEVHRTAGGTLAAKQRELAEAKSARLTALDSEVRALEARLGEPHAEPVLSEPGIGGACDECGELYSSDAHYCFRCGNPLDDHARAARQATIAPTASQDTEPGQASVLWAGGPRSEAAGAPPRGEGPASPATSQWLLAQDPAPAAGALFSPAPAEPAPASPEEPSATDQFAAAAEDSAAASDESAAGDEQAGAADGPTSDDQPIGATGEPTTGDQPEAAPEALTADDEPVAGLDEPAAAAADQPAAGDEPDAATDKVTDDEPVAPIDAPGAAAADAPATVDEPEAAATDAPAAEDEPEAAATDAPAAGDEPEAAATDEPAAEHEPEAAATDEPAASDEPEAAATDELAASDEPEAAATDEPAASDEPEAAATDEPAAGDDPSGAADDGVASSDEPGGGDGSDAETRVLDSVDEPNGRVTSADHVRWPGRRP